MMATHHTLTHRWQRGRCLWWCPTFDFQTDLVFSFTQKAAGHACIRAFIFWSGTFNLQGPIVVDTVMATVHATALSVFKPAATQKTDKNNYERLLFTSLQWFKSVSDYDGLADPYDLFSPPLVFLPPPLSLSPSPHLTCPPSPFQMVTVTASYNESGSAQGFWLLKVTFFLISVKNTNGLFGLELCPGICLFF